ncbi:hypothetical protein [Actinokineospora cianjurensis]|uniref:Uncharacterized protein n=1 Tax=Actinokineospora cianjurensis TaxID=585224 RepID=A0A421AVH0_9PSEU|nr:hypothetical protein [Actinokineospora cianjurensis]RLK53730.1 hypothetical protein CLV68_6653 [Actinokineospora cianjurensis]
MAASIVSAGAPTGARRGLVSTGLVLAGGGVDAPGWDLGDQGSSSGKVLTIIAGADTGSVGRGGNFGTARNG